MKLNNLSNDAVVRFWTTQQYEEGRAKNGNLFFEDVTIYSYSYEFPLARFYETSEGDFVLLSSKADTKSATTRKHAGLVRDVLAAINCDVLEVPVVKAYRTYEHRCNVAHFIKEAESELRSADRRRNPAKRNIDVIQASIAASTAEEYARLFEVELDWDKYKKTLSEAKLRAAAGN